MFKRAPRRTLLILLFSLLALTLGPVPAGAWHFPKGTVDVQILGINDFHGQLEPVPSTSSGGRVGATPAGGAEYLATHLAALEATNPNTAIVAAGDLIGATPLVSALFHDEPTIEALNHMGLDYAAVGNHEFDEGSEELKRMQHGGCHPVDGCIDGDGFEGADFQYLSANVVRERWPHLPLFPPYAIRNFNGVKVAFVGLVLEGTPSIVTASGVAGLRFLDEAQTLNHLIPWLRFRGAQTVVVLIHEGGAQNVAASETTIDTCQGFTGLIAPIVEATDDEVDLWISGHTHLPYNCVIDGDPVTSAFSTGRVVTDVDMTIDRRTGEPTQILVDNKIVTRDVALDPDITALIGKYNTISAPLRNRLVGTITADILRANNAAGESALGDVIADAQLESTDDPAMPGGPAVIAFMNSGGIRTDLLFNQISAIPPELPGQVTYAEMFNVQPFGNSMVTMTVTGAQIVQLLNEQWKDCTSDPLAPAAPRFLQVSSTFSYQWSVSATGCNRVLAGNVLVNGAPINVAAEYRITVNSFLADGGDSFPVLKLGSNRVGGDVDTDAFEDYFTAHGAVSPGPQNRITTIP
jgi:5'-nucleotidase